MPLHVKREDVPERKGVRTGAEGEGSMVSVKGYGNECSLMIASRAPGYHTTPHIHESEQLNYIQEGEIGSLSRNRVFTARRATFKESRETKCTGPGTDPTRMPSSSKPTPQAWSV